MKPADVLASFSDGDEMSQIRMLAKNWSLLSGGCLENTSGTFHFSSPHNGFKVLSICKKREEQMDSGEPWNVPLFDSAASDFG